MAGGQLPQLRYLLLAAIERKRAASVETASGRRVGRGGNLPFENYRLSLFVRAGWSAAEIRACV